jgi:valyl-tRNA synthetase
MDDLIANVRRVRRWRDLVGVPAASVLAARLTGGQDEADEGRSELLARLARLRLDGADGERIATLGPVEILASEEIDSERAERRIEERRAQLRQEVERAEGKLANQRFVAKAPREVVDAEREKLDVYRIELAELA